MREGLRRGEVDRGVPKLPESRLGDLDPETALGRGCDDRQQVGQRLAGAGGAREGHVSASERCVGELGLMAPWRMDPLPGQP